MKFVKELVIRIFTHSTDSTKSMYMSYYHHAAIYRSMDEMFPLYSSFSQSSLLDFFSSHSSRPNVSIIHSNRLQLDRRIDLFHYTLFLFVSSMDECEKLAVKLTDIPFTRQSIAMISFM
jgi:hypothetical protein